jgi:hypothetical protein
MQTKHAKIVVVAAAVMLLGASFQPAQAGNVMQETYDLSGFPSNGVLVLMDTTHVDDIVSGHVVATLPIEGTTCDTDGVEPFPGLSVMIGVARDREDGHDLAQAELKNTGIEGATVRFGPPPSQSGVVTCVFHADIEPDLSPVGRITDVAFINGVVCPGQGPNHCSLPAGTSIGLAVKLVDD